jgi:hypothetical protein
LCCAPIRLKVLVITQTGHYGGKVSTTSRIAGLLAVAVAAVVLGVGGSGWSGPVGAAPLPVDVWALATNGGRPVVLQDGQDAYDLPFDVGGARLGMQITIDLDLTDLPRTVRVGKPYFVDVDPAPACTAGGLRVVCELTTDTHSLRGGLRVAVPAGAEPRVGSYRLTVTGDRVDPDPGNNTVTVPVQVRRAPRADLAFATTGAAAAVGGLAVVRIQVVNHGPDAAAGWRHEVTAPTGTQYLGCAGPAGDCGAGYDLRPGASAVLSLSFRVTAPTVGEGAWQFDPVRRDPVKANNVLPALGSLIQVVAASATEGPPSPVPSATTPADPGATTPADPGTPTPPGPSPTAPAPSLPTPPAATLSAAPVTPAVGVSGTGRPPRAAAGSAVVAPFPPGMGPPPEPMPLGSTSPATGGLWDITRQALIVLAMVIAVPLAVLAGLAARRRYLDRWSGRHSL